MVRNISNNKGRWTQRALLRLAQPYVRRELPKWASVYDLLIGSFQRDRFWSDAPIVRGRNKYFGFECDYDLSRWADRMTFVLGRWNDLAEQLLHHAVNAKTVVDIGANRGEFTMAAAAMKPDAKVIAFEPNPAMSAILKADLERNSIENVELNEFALSDRNETLTLHVPYVNAGSASFGGFESEGYTIKAPVRVGDEVLAGAKPDLIKIDVEGFELRVVNGLKDVIAAAQAIIATEFFAENLERCGTSTDELRALFSDLAYQGFGLSVTRRGAHHELKLGGEHTDVVWLPSHVEPQTLHASTRDLQRLYC